MPDSFLLVFACRRPVVLKRLPTLMQLILIGNRNPPPVFSPQPGAPMILCIAEVLSSEQLSRIRTQLSASRFQDGKETAGWHARLGKQNEQAAPQEPDVQALKQEVEQSLGRHPLFQMAARPKRLSPILFSRYREGMTYGNHVDDPVMGRGDERLRSDLSFTLFLTGEDDYDGGRSEEHTSELQSRENLVCRLLLEKKK